ncbi:MAG: PspA/IM30 family protein [Thiolinea sp.]
MFNLILKLSTAMRGGAREVLETAVDANAIRIFAQEIHECETNIQQAKKHLAGVMAEKLKLGREIKARQTNINKREQVIRDKLAQEDEAAALKLAEELAQQEALVDTLQQQHNKLETYEQELMQSLTATAHKLEQHRAELRMAQATQHAQKATGKLLQPVNDYTDQFGRMQESLQRIRRQQEDFGDRVQAMDEIEAQLKGEPAPGQQRQQAAEAVLERLKAA